MKLHQDNKPSILIIRKCRFLFAIIFISLLVNYSTALSQNNKNNSARFLVVSDFGGAASEDQRSVASAMAKEAVNIGAQFVVTAGDNYHLDGIASTSDKRWKTEFEDVYDYLALQIPWYPSLGNHDCRGSVQAEIDYSKITSRWKFEARYYTQNERIDDSNYVLIVHLDTSPFIESYREGPIQYHLEGQDYKKQMVWLDSVLTVTKARWTIVVGHHSIYASASKSGNTKELIENVYPILTKHHVPLYICGHYHVLQHLRRDNMDFAVCGGGAKFGTVDQRDDVQFGAGSLGFLSINVSSKNIKVNFINDKNILLHSFEIEKSVTKK